MSKSLTTRVPDQGFSIGQRVKHQCSPWWRGIVIPLPAGRAAVGIQGPLVWVMRDQNYEIRGCYPWNLERVP